MKQQLANGNWPKKPRLAAGCSPDRNHWRWDEIWFGSKYF
jgi:hypothetical protein